MERMIKNRANKKTKLTDKELLIGDDRVLFLLINVSFFSFLLLVFFFGELFLFALFGHDPLGLEVLKDVETTGVHVRNSIVEVLKELTVVQGIRRRPEELVKVGAVNGEKQTDLLVEEERMVELFHVLQVVHQKLLWTPTSNSSVELARCDQS